MWCLPPPYCTRIFFPFLHTFVNAWPWTPVSKLIKGVVSTFGTNPCLIQWGITTAQQDPGVLMKSYLVHECQRKSWRYSSEKAGSTLIEHEPKQDKDRRKKWGVREWGGNIKNQKVNKVWGGWWHKTINREKWKLRMIVGRMLRIWRRACINSDLKRFKTQTLFSSEFLCQTHHSPLGLN